MIDIILPGQGGLDLILDLHASNPDLGIIITSGKIDMTITTFKVLAHQFWCHFHPAKTFYGRRTPVDG